VIIYWSRCHNIIHHVFTNKYVERKQVNGPASGTFR
jgi:hypothetical protein